MRRLLLAALLLAAPGASALAEDGPAYRPPQPPRAAGVVVYRGSARQLAPPVTIYRGSAAPPARQARVDAAPRSGIVPVAGTRLWLVDDAGDRLVACRLARTAAAGRRAIRCSEGRLRLD